MALYYTQDGYAVDATPEMAAAQGWTQTSPFRRGIGYDPTTGWAGISAQQIYDQQHGAGAYQQAVQQFTQLAQAGQLGAYEQLYGAFPVGDAAGIDAWMKKAFTGGAETAGNQDAAAQAGDFVESGKLAKLILAGVAGGAAGEVLGTGSLLPTDTAPTQTLQSAIDPTTARWGVNAGVGEAGAGDLTIGELASGGMEGLVGAGTGAAGGAGLDLAKLGTTAAVGAGATAATSALTGGDSGGSTAGTAGYDPGTGVITPVNDTSGIEDPISPGPTATGVGPEGVDQPVSPDDPGFIKWLKDTTGLTPADLAKIGGSVIPALIAAYGSSQQRSDFRDLASKYMEMGAPYRQRLSQYENDPMAFLNSPEVQGPIQQSVKQNMNALSVTSGNPYGSPNALQKSEDWTANTLFSRLGEEKDRLAGYGGLTAYTTAGPAASTAAANATGNIYGAVGAGATNLFNPPKSAAQQMAEFRTLMQGIGT